MAEASERLQRLLGGPALASLRTRLRARFARERDSDSFTLARLGPAERGALEGLLGRKPRESSSLRVSRAELDAVLRGAGLAHSLRHALELLEGPIPNLEAERAEHERAWLAALSAAAHSQLIAYLADGAGRGLVKRLAQGSAELGGKLIRDTNRVLVLLPVQGIPRSQLAAHALGDAHALDTGRATATLVMAVLRDAEDEDDRQTWARAGVLVNELAAPALALNLPGGPDTLIGAMCELAWKRGSPLHLSLRSLLRERPLFHVRERDVFVCENPNIVAIAADRLGMRCAPLVCTDGMPSASQRVLLERLAEQGARLRYHGDFDWPGIAIANFVMRKLSATPWRFTVSDYSAGRGRQLEGSAVVASWDADLAPTMIRGGTVLEEEHNADQLLDDLAN